MATIKKVFITGATAGFGKATAEIFAENGHDLVITGRREKRLLDLKRRLETEYKITVKHLCFDVRNEDEVYKEIETLPKRYKNVDVLVNNAGLASGFDFVQDGNTEDWDKMIDTNVKGLLYVSKAIIPYMIERGKGHIINVGSTAGKEVYPKGNVYCASKHAVDAITKGMRIDLLEHGIKVTQIAPGMADTEFSTVRFHGDKKKAKQVYKGFKPMTAHDVASLIYYSTTLPKHLCINDLVVTALAQANSYVTHKS